MSDEMAEVHEALVPEQFFGEAAQLHQTWIRRFDTQNRRRPRPPDVESERLRLVRRLQLVQRLQLEDLAPDTVLERLVQLRSLPDETRLVENDEAFLDALINTWTAARLPQASSLTAGAHPPKPSATVQFRW